MMMREIRSTINLAYMHLRKQGQQRNHKESDPAKFCKSHHPFIGKANVLLKEAINSNKVHQDRLVLCCLDGKRVGR